MKRITMLALMILVCSQYLCAQDFSIGLISGVTTIPSNYYDNNVIVNQPTAGFHYGIKAKRSTDNDLITLSAQFLVTKSSQSEYNMKVEANLYFLEMSAEWSLIKNYHGVRPYLAFNMAYIKYSDMKITGEHIDDMTLEGFSSGGAGIGGGVEIKLSHLVLMDLKTDYNFTNLFWKKNSGNDVAISHVSLALLMAI